MREERKAVTALDADVVGSTALAERLDAEEVRLVVGEAIARMVAAVEALGGTVKDLAGDGILALFGAPVAHEDDAERAVRAGLRIAEEMADYGSEVAKRLGHRRLRGPGRCEHRLGRPRPGRRRLARRVRRDRGSDQHGRPAPEGRVAGHGARRRVDAPTRGDAVRLGGAGAVRAQGQAGRGHRVPGDRRACGSRPGAWRAGPRDAVRGPRRAARSGA